MKRKIIILNLVLIFVLSFTVSASDQWGTFVNKDEMTEEETWHATSPLVEATKTMNFPYSSVMAWLGVGYDGEDQWVYIGFTDPPNLTNTTLKDGYYIIPTRIKWDDKMESVTLAQNWGSRVIYFKNDKTIVSKIIKSNTVLLELEWFGEGKVYFRFPLSGSSDAINKIHNAFE